MAQVVCFFNSVCCWRGGEGDGSHAPGGRRFVTGLPGMTTCLQRQVVFFFFLLWYLILVYPSKRGCLVMGLFYIEFLDIVKVTGYVFLNFLSRYAEMLNADIQQGWGFLLWPQCWATFGLLFILVLYYFILKYDLINLDSYGQQ